MVKFDPRLLREPGQTEIDLINQLDVYRKRPRQWASSIPLTPTKWMKEGDAKQLELLLEIVRERTQTVKIRRRVCDVTEDHGF